MDKSKQNWAKGRKMMVQCWIWKNSAMTFTCDLETWFKVTTYLLPKSTLSVRYEPDMDKEKICDLNKDFTDFLP